MSSSLYSISVIVPAYNEERNLESAILHTINTFQSLEGIDYEIIIVDDKSSDNTGEIAKNIAGRYPVVRYLRHEANQGSGVAFRTGIANATKDYVMFVPVDSPIDPEDMKSYLPRMNICDIVVGYRVERVGYSRLALFNSFVYNRILIPLLFNIGITDVNWVQLYRRRLFSDGIISFGNSRIFFFVEILVKARRRGLIIAEVPSRMKKRMYGSPTHTRLSIIMCTLWDMFRFFFASRKEEKNRTLQ